MRNALAPPSATHGRTVTRREPMDRKVIPQRAYYAVERGLPVAPVGSQPTVPADGEARLTTGASVLIILLTSLGLWAVMWMVVTSLA